MTINPHDPTPSYLAFWREHHYATLTTHRRDGSPHVVPVGVTYDPGSGLARVIANKASAKVGNVLTTGPDGARVALCQVHKARWATLEGLARVSGDEAAIAEAVRHYTARYGRTPSPNPDRVVIQIALTRAMGNA